VELEVESHGTWIILLNKTNNETCMRSWVIAVVVVVLAVAAVVGYLSLTYVKPASVYVYMSDKPT
jgi:hypothetical protein